MGNSLKSARFLSRAVCTMRRAVTPRPVSIWVSSIRAAPRGSTSISIEAHKWFNIAAVSGSERAQECRAEIAEDMTAREIIEAQKAARAWLRGLEMRAA